MNWRLVIASVVLLLAGGGVETHGQVQRHESAHERFALADPSWFLAGFGTGENGANNDLLTDAHNQLKFRFVLQSQIIPIGKYGDGVHGSFRQVSFWDPYTRNAPALDNTYTPEVFLYWDNGYSKRGKSWRWSKPSLRLSFTHQSNGLGGEESRTWNRFILKTEFGDLSHSPLLLRFAVWHIFNDVDNPDIEDELGYGSVELDWQPLRREYPDGLRVLGIHTETNWGVTGRIFKRFELDLFAHPLLLDRRLAWMPTVMVQYFTGRGESLLLYNRDTHALRVGCAFFL